MTKLEAIQEIKNIVSIGYVNWEEYMDWIIQPTWISEYNRYESKEEIEQRLITKGERLKWWRENPSPRLIKL